MTERHHLQNYYETAELAAAYDDDCAGRRDLDFYFAMTQRLNPRTIVDIGSGTGLLAGMLAAAGYDVIAVEPQATMLDIAARQPHAEHITWRHGDAADLAPGCADLVLMTGHVAQYFLDDTAWREVLTATRRALRPGGHLAFEVRNQAIESWRRWETPHPRPTSRGTIRQSVHRADDLVTHVDEYDQGGKRWVTTETLRFPSWHAVARGLRGANFQIIDAWGDWDGSPVTDLSPEWIVLARAVENEAPASSIRTRATPVVT